jgi:3-methyladenine DNA glycosylase AlkC
MTEETAAPLLKDGFNATTVEGIARSIAAAHPPFSAQRFVADCLDGFESLSLMARVGRVAQGLVRHLPAPFEQAVAVLQQAMGEPGAPSREVQGMAAFRHAPHLQFVADAGLEHPEAALDALAWMTRHFSGEFAVRPFLQRDPASTLARMQHWCTHDDPRVRRLASEGSRPLLPWARRVSHLVDDPSLTVALIDALAGDPDEVVRRSAANHLNDISRLDPALAAEVARGWIGRGLPDGARTVNRGLRTLIKQGHPQALGLLGFAVDDAFLIDGPKLDRKRVPIGGKLAFRFALRRADATPAAACVDYAVCYASANGAVRRKVFKGEVRQVEPGLAESFEFVRDFVVRSTRRLYPGAHRVEVLVNGRLLGAADFQLTET